MTVHEQLVTILVDLLGVEVEEITHGASLTHDLGADSLDVIQVALALEEALGIEIGDDDLDELAKGTVGQALAYLEAQLAAATSPEARRG